MNISFSKKHALIKQTSPKWSSLFGATAINVMKAMYWNFQWKSFLFSNLKAEANSNSQQYLPQSQLKLSQLFNYQSQWLARPSDLVWPFTPRGVCNNCCKNGTAWQAHLPGERHEALRGIGRCTRGATSSASCREGVNTHARQANSTFNTNSVKWVYFTDICSCYLHWLF